MTLVHESKKEKERNLRNQHPMVLIIPTGLEKGRKFTRKSKGQLTRDARKYVQLKTGSVVHYVPRD
jgi:hypothetical protein